MEKINLYVFWIGDKKKIKFEKINSRNFNLVLGPTEAEHEFLSDNYPYYKKSFENKKWSFCSDIWRLYVLSKNPGLYIDASVQIGENIDILINKLKGFNVGVFRGNFKYFESGVLWSGVRDNDFFSNILKKYYYKREMPISSFIMPVFLSAELLKLGIEPGWLEIKKDEFIILPLNEIRNKKTLWKTSVGSWGKNRKVDYFKAVEQDNWSGWQKLFENKEEAVGWSTRVERAIEGHFVDVTLLKEFYEDVNFAATNELRKNYREISYKKKFNELLIWSKLYRFFAKMKK